MIFLLRGWCHPTSFCILLKTPSYLTFFYCASKYDTIKNTNSLGDRGVFMRCPKCNCNKSSVIDSRQAEEGTTIRRRRECDQCHYRFTTFERIEDIPLVVVKKDGTRESFSREKIYTGIIRSAQKRPVSAEVIDQAIARIEQTIRSDYDNEVPSEVIGNLVMDELADLDEITYVRFASVYRSFKDVDELEELLHQLTKSMRTKKKRLDKDASE